MVKFKSIVLPILIAALISVAAATVVLINTSPLKREGVYVVVDGFESYGYDSLGYQAGIYVGRELVRRIYMIIPMNNTAQKPLKIHIPVVSDSKVKSLKITFTPPLNTALDDLAWVVTTINTPVRFYKDGASVVWECEDMGFYGEGTISLEFAPRYHRSGYFKGVTITFNMTLEYRGQRYTVTHDVAIN